MHTLKKDLINKENLRRIYTKKTFLSIILLSLILISSCSKTPSNSLNLEDNKVVMYKSVNCGCCVQYAPYLKGKGFNVESISTNTEEIKKQYNIPYNMQSCHTAVIGDYFVEGHVPIEAINKLLEEKPDIDGISLPGMPSGSPGMPGNKQEPFKIYAITNGVATEYITL